ncbi:MAG: hypothetical protein ACREFY_07185 [Acetobacteraceae bacterium]
MASCYGMVALVATLGIFGIAFKISAALWGAAITVLSALSWLALVRNARSHGRTAPACLGLVGFCAVAWAMMIRYSASLEIAGFGVQLVAVLWDHRHCRRRCGTG